MPNYPDVVKGLVYRKNFNMGIFKHPLCIKFTKEEVNNPKTPFITKRTNDQNCPAGSRVNFLSKEDATAWPEGDNVFLTKMETTAVRVDINNEIPVYADIDWVKQFKSETINPIIKERMKKAPQPNPFVSDEQAKYNAKMEQKKQFEEWLLNNYSPKPYTTTYSSPDSYCITAEELAPSTAFKGILNFHLLTSSYKIDTCSFWVDDLNTVFSKNLLINIFNNMSTRSAGNYKDGELEYLQYLIKQKTDITTETTFYSNIKRIELVDFIKYNGLSYRATFEIDLTKNKIKVDFKGLLSNSFPYSKAKETFETLIEFLKQYLAINFKTDNINKLNTFLTTFDKQSLHEEVYINKDEVARNSIQTYDLSSSDEEKFKVFSEYLRENFWNEILEERVEDILKALLEKGKSNSYAYTYNLSFLYVYFKKVLEIDIFKLKDLSWLFINNYYRWYFWPEDEEEIVLPKEIFTGNKQIQFFINSNIPARFIIPEGVTNIYNLKLETTSNSLQLYIYIPKSVKDCLDLNNFGWSCRQRLYYKDDESPVNIVFEPVEGGHSSFKLNKLLFEKYKNKIIAK